MVDYRSALMTRGNIKDGATVSADNTGLVIMGNDGTNYQDIAVDSSGQIKLSGTIEVNLDNANDDVLIYGWDGSANQKIKTDASGNLQVDVLSGAGGTQYAEDTAHTTGDTGTMALAVRSDTLAALAGTTGDYSPLQVNASGALYTEVSSALPTGANSIGTVGLDAGANSIGTVGLDTGTNTIGSVKVTDGSNVLSVAQDGSAQVTFGVEVMGTDGAMNQTLKTDSAGQLYVIQSSASLTEVTTYATANLVKDSATTVASYSPASGTDQIGGFVVSGSGRMKVDVQWGTTLSETTQMVFFTNSDFPNIMYNFPDNMQHNLASTETIKIVCTNMEDEPSTGSDFAGYATILTAQ